jgi:transcriptional regulator with XRE-family HTH domain
VIATLSKKLLDKLLRREYRAAYVEENVRTGIAYQIRSMREHRGMSQTEVGSAMNKPQSTVSRLEDPDYGRLTVKSLLEVAAVHDVALLIQYVSFPEFIRRTRDLSPEALNAESFDASRERVS